MIYLSGVIKPEYATWIPGTARPFGQLTHARKHDIFETASDRGNGIGFLHTPKMGNRAVPGVIWAADNGCFTDPYGFDLDKYVAWLQSRDAATCLFATAPDYLGDWSCTIERYYEVHAGLSSAGIPTALVAQDGLEYYIDRIDWDDIDALFLGGSTEWKLSEDAADCVAEAKAAGCWVHMGRVNSGRRIRRAIAMGCDSADGTYLAYTGAAGHADLVKWLTPGAQLELAA